MIYVIFEVVIKETCMDRYLSIATSLKEELASMDGFIRSERFVSVQNERKLLSLSVWKDEDAVTKWRNQAKHRESQRMGKKEFFDSYTITVTTPLRQYSDDKREEAPEDSRLLLG